MGAYFFTVYFTFNNIEEDAFIYFRVAENIAAGEGYVFNAGEERVETGSGLSWQLLLAVVALLPVNIIIATKLLGIVCACLALFVVLKISEKLIDDPVLAIFPPLLLAVSTPFYFWSHRGLETPLYVLLMVWLFYWLICEERIRFWYVPAFLVFVSRPEGFLMVGPIFLLLFLCRNNVPKFYQGLVIFLSLCALVQLSRFFYFGDIFPHPFYHKMGKGNYLTNLDHVWTYSLYSLIPLLLLLSVKGLIAEVRASSPKPVLLKPSILLLIFLLLTTVWAVIGSDWKSFNRQLAQWLPFVFIFVVWMLQKGFADIVPRKILIAAMVLLSIWLLLGSRYTTSNGGTRLNPTLGGIVLLSNAPGFYNADLWGALTNPDDYIEKSEPRLAGDFIGFNRNATVGRFIKENYPEGITVVFDQMGQAPWYAGLDKRFIDNEGLTDKQIGYASFYAQSKDSTVYGAYGKLLKALKSIQTNASFEYGDLDQQVDRLLSLKPEVVLIRERYLKKRPGSLIARFHNHSDFSTSYRKVFRLNRRDVVYQRNDMSVISEPIVPPASLVEKRW